LLAWEGADPRKETAMTDLDQDTAAPRATAAEDAETSTAAAERPSWGKVAKTTRDAAALVNQRTKAAGELSAAQIRARPLRAVGVALGAGLVLGALLFG
jgi:ElaB/YqjD/DUF883 family membrane-anchored ribosome-binding protein